MELSTDLLEKMNLLKSQGHETLAQSLGMRFLLETFLTKEFFEGLELDLNPHITIGNTCWLVARVMTERDFRTTKDEVMAYWLTISVTGASLNKPTT